jgi:hypothetical protein
MLYITVNQVRVMYVVQLMLNIFLISKNIFYIYILFRTNLFSGKKDRKDVYQSPYVWVQFLNLTAHVLISVECRIFGANIFYDKIAQRASIRFQLYLNKNL